MENPVFICHSNIPPDAPADEMDVIDQAEWFKTGLQCLGLEFMSGPFALDWLVSGDGGIKPRLIINLVETIDGNGRLIHIAPSIFEHYGIPFTGCSSESIYQTSNKLLAKKIMRWHGISTPEWIEPGDQGQGRIQEGRKYIIKSVWEHASVGMDEHNMKLPDDHKGLLAELSEKNKGDRGFFAEQYVHGREFNISLLETAGGPVTLPPAEILFTGYPADKPRIVGYRAKWDKHSFEYHNTIRSFDREKPDDDLYGKMEEISLRLWDIFRLRGYARVDFRVDEGGNPLVLEINANPCVTGDSGFVAAAGRAGLEHHEIVRNIINSAGRNGKYRQTDF
jgi:D-alanine-D-alanine ligase